MYNIPRRTELVRWFRQRREFLEHRLELVETDVDRAWTYAVKDQEQLDGDLDAGCSETFFEFIEQRRAARAMWYDFSTGWNLEWLPGGNICFHSDLRDPRRLQWPVPMRYARDHPNDGDAGPWNSMRPN